jgi:RHH-type transcriptional regulator, proline utilization regulon repressor / proline dehydrogenase / delta 1-pyrroline-5-carboxylate dehydrogenase
VKTFIAEDEASIGSAVGAAINDDYLADELPLVRALAAQARLDPPARERVAQRAVQLVEAVRIGADAAAGIDEFLQTYGLDSQEGVLLLCLAEALLRIPDAATADRLIADRLGRGDWRAHLDDSASLFVNASTFGLMLTGALLTPDATLSRDPQGWLRGIVGRIGEPVARTALRQAMRILSQQFIFGTDLEGALKRAAGARGGERYSFDMLGEAAMNSRDARHHLEAYRDAVAQVGRAAQRGAGAGTLPLAARNSVSVKLSALHPRYELAQRERVHAELLPAISDLLAQAEQAGIGLTIDAEECERLELSLQLFEQLLRTPAAARAGQLGLAVQAYQKRSLRVIDWLVARLRASERHITLRLVKGAYWDTEIKRAQQAGLASYPVFTRKQHTDIAYLACARRLAAHREHISAQFATHNAHTVAYVAELYGSETTAFEYQRLHGMGEALYEAVRAGAAGTRGAHYACRVYAPVGPQSELLPYLVRRLLENGANTSFVHRAGDRGQAASEVVRDPTDAAPGGGAPFVTTLPEPARMFAPERRNSAGINLHDSGVLALLARECGAASRSEWLARPMIGGAELSGPTTPVVNPADHADLAGECVSATAQQVQQAALIGAQSWPEWDAAGGAQRAAVLERAAELFERERAGLLARCVREAGKTLADSVSEWREAIDFLRYYAVQARAEFTQERSLPGPAGEANTLRLRARGVFGCISPWNFPLAIFTGQIAAALAAGNSVLAKPAEQTPLTAAFATALLHQAGVPAGVLQLLPGDGAVGAAITSLEDLAGVAFTGSSDTAQLIARSLAARRGAIATLIAETGGQNALIADSSALVEQVVQDLLTSSYNSAGQRCSAVRVLYVQEELAPRLIEALCGAMDELVLGDPALLSTDIGPLIDAPALAALELHARRLGAAGQLLHRGRAPRGGLAGFYFAPLLAEIGSIGELESEVFGPVLHVVRFRGSEIARVVDDINATGFGLTLGIHTRIESRALQIAQRARVGNVYVNRNTIGAVVGVQPFGGCNRSGTGPKAGGPHYLTRFATEQCLTVNTAAVGGNAALLSQG